MADKDRKHEPDAAEIAAEEQAKVVAALDEGEKAAAKAAKEAAREDNG